MFFWLTLVHIFFILNPSECYLCQNRPIHIYGQCGPLICPFFAAISKPYHDFRRPQNLDVTVDILSGDFYVNNGLIGKADDKKPVVFVGTHHNFELTKNEIKFPLIGQKLNLHFFGHSSLMMIIFTVTLLLNYIALVIIFNLPNIDELNITVATLAEIYNGSVQYWNDRKIHDLNPTVTLPFAKIVPVARLGQEDAATGLFTGVLSSGDPEWAAKYGTFFGPNFVGNTCCNAGGPCCKSKSWPTNVPYKFAMESVGAVAVVTSLEYTIGYATVNTIKVDNDEVHYANFVNNGSTVKPSVESVQKAIQYSVNKSSSDKFDIDLDNASYMANAYPLSFVSYLTINFTYDFTTLDCCVIQEMVGFVDWLITIADSVLLEDLGYVSITEVLKSRIKRLALPNVKCRQSFVYKLYLDSLNSTTQMASWLIAVIVAGAFLGLGLIIGLAYYVYYKKYYVDESKWMLDPNRIKLVSQMGGHNQEKSGMTVVDTTSIHSVGSVVEKSSATSKPASKEADDPGHQGRGVARDMKEFMVNAELDENDVYLDSLECKIPQQWTNASKRLVYRMKNFVCKNVATLLGIAVINNEPCAVFEYLTKGTLHFVLKTSRYNLTDEIKYQFAIDVGEGLKYIHQYGLVHGYLNSITCYVDSSWTVKIVQWERLSLYRQENYRSINEYAAFEPDSIFDESRLIEYLYMDPNLLVANAQQIVDLYSYGFLLLEIFTRKLPYSEEIEDGDESYTNILKRKFLDKHPVHPRSGKVSKDLYQIFSACSHVDQDQRPTMAKVVKQLGYMAKISNGIVDIIMDTLEAQADALEDKVEERTSALKEVTDKMRNLLNEVLPPQIAEQLLKGESVAPEQFDCITVYFSDIVGFAGMSIKSTPTEIMTLLNDLWTEFDNVIDKFDAYKADAIADCYMVCSGIPKRNGMDHCRQICLLGLALMDMCSSFKIKHMPEEQLKIRIGINSGPATAGVIGSKMPQYCIFGDTVNTASRMESTSLPLKIQMSERANKLLMEHFPDTFHTEYRGEITVKGKGTQTTYWLHGLLKKQ